MKLLQSYLKNKPSSQSPLGIVNHELFLKKNRAQATSLKLQATGGRVGPKRYKHQGWVGP